MACYTVNFYKVAVYFCHARGFVPRAMSLSITMEEFVVVHL